MDWFSPYMLLGGFAFGLGAPKIFKFSVRFFRIAVSGQSMKMVFVVRNDLGMGKGKVASQCSHAAIQCYVNGLKSQKEMVEMWLQTGQPKIVLKASSEDELNALYEKAKSLKLISCVIRDAGRTQLETGTATVLGIGPGHASTVDSITSHLKLL